MAETTVGKLLLKRNLPKSLHEFVDKTTLDKKGISQLFDKVVQDHPTEYKTIVSNLARLGFETSTRLGSTVDLADLHCPVDKKKYFEAAEEKVKQIKKGTGTKEQKDQKILEVYTALSKKLQNDIIDVGIKKNQTLAKVIVSGSRGSPTQYQQTIASPVLVADAQGKPMIDFPIYHSFAEGLSLPEYLAHSFGTRAGTISTKLAVADSGAVSKQLGRAASTLRIEEHDCGTHNGISVTVTDKDSIGAYLAKPIAGFKYNNEVTAKMLAELKNKGVTNIVIRSPITCQAPKNHHSGAICQMCAGKRDKGTLPAMKSFVGLTAAAPVGEGLSQGMLNAKHTAGSAKLDASQLGGFKVVEQMVNIPKTFRYRAVVFSEDGVVKAIRDLPQGGKEIRVENANGKIKDYYISPGFEPKVRVGQKVEEGDVGSEGLVNPADAVKHRGIGDGRKVFMESMKQVLDNSGVAAHRRNLEVVAKANIDHVKITSPDGLGDHLPDSIVSYHTIEKEYKPRPGHKVVRTDLARGQYLEVPVLHYSIGTKITSRVISDLKSHGIESITVNPTPPPFEPEMVRLVDVPKYNPDWASQLYSTYLESRLLDSVSRGAVSDLKGASPILGLAYGANFSKYHK